MVFHANRVISYFLFILNICMCPNIRCVQTNFFLKKNMKLKYKYNLKIYDFFPATKYMKPVFFYS